MAPDTQATPSDRSRPVSGADLLGQRVTAAVRIIATSHLDGATAALARLGRDPEALHDFRVAVRRLRTLVRAYRPWVKRLATKRVLRGLRALGRATNAGRDAEVQIAWLAAQRDGLRRSERAGLNWLLRILGQIKRTSYAAARKAVRRDCQRVARLIRLRLDEEVERSASPPYQGAFGMLLRDHAKFLGDRLREVRQPDDVDQAHDARIMAKRLRYLLEPAAAAVTEGKQAVKAVKRLQDLLGDLHDMHVMEELLADALTRVARDKTRQLHSLALEGRQADFDRARRRDERLGLLALAARARARRDALFAQLSRAWLFDHGATWLGPLRETGDVLALSGSAAAEVERKFLLSAVPDGVEAMATRADEIHQGWIPGTRLRDRLRVVRAEGTERWFRTLKFGAGIERVELEDETTRDVFEALWPLTEGRRVRKRRYHVPAEGSTWEIDVFQDRDLVLAEIELPTADTAVVIPDWMRPLLEREVTGDAAYVNERLAQ
ncbi:MAG TPA: CHAD domain-containing protein [Gemmatimonadales bacterium]